jgi:putative transposase
MSACQEISPEVGTSAACGALDIPRATFYRRLSPDLSAPARKRPAPPRALTVQEREQVLEVLHTDRFVDRAPTEVYAKLLDEGTYLCSSRTMYRILSDAEEVRERRDQLRHPEYKAPELLATASNQVWSWDITKLLGPVKWTYFYLYVILDIFSRYVVGWMLADAESAKLAKRLIDETCRKEGIQAGQLTIHADRGSAMTAQPVVALMANLGITKTHSRPHVSDDNPYSEAQFKTLKYCPAFPERFGSIEDAATFCRAFFPWYNQEHRHSGIGLMTPATVHHGKSEVVNQVREAALLVAFSNHPERFVRGTPRPPLVPEVAWINKPRTDLNRSQNRDLEEKSQIPRVPEYGFARDRRSSGISEADSSDPDTEVTRNDIKFVRQVSQNH